MPPPHTRSMFMFADFAMPSSFSYVASVILGMNESLGIQSAPLQNIFSPFISMTNDVPSLSGSCSNRTVRIANGTSRRSISSSRNTRENTAWYIGCSPYPFGHQSFGFFMRTRNFMRPLFTFRSSAAISSSSRISVCNSIGAAVNTEISIDNSTIASFFVMAMTFTNGDCKAAWA